MTTAAVNNKVNPSNFMTKRTLQKKQDKLGPYNLLQTLGEGEFGKVKLGIHMETGQEVAIKLIKKEGIGSDSRINKVEREISVLKILQHPYIVKLFNVVETDKYIGIILEYASGGELFEYILAHRFLKEKDAKKFFAQLISSVQYMHERNIVHRDLKLENLLLDKNRNIIVTDFGFANQFESEADDLMATTCGSPCYAAPELVVNSGLYAGSAVDIWSCGVILYAMLCGFLPFDDDPSNPESDNINQLYKYIMSTNLDFPSHVSEEARDLLLKMLVPDPAKRCALDHVIQHPWLKEYRSMFKTKNNGKADSDKNNTPQVGIEARKTHIPVVARERFAPVTNDKFLSSTTEKSKKTFLNFAISQPSATTTDSPVHVTSSMKTSKVPNMVARKPVKEDDHEMHLSPEKSLSSPISINEHKPFHISTFGTIYRSQRRQTDKLFSFFTHAKASQEDTPVVEMTHQNVTLSDVSTVDISDEDIAYPATPATPTPHLYKHSHEQETPTDVSTVSEQEDSTASPYRDTESQIGSLVSDHGGSFRSSNVSFKDPSRQEMHSSVLRHQSDESSPEDRKVQPEVSTSTRIASKAVGDSGRKAIAAVRKSIYRKSKTPHVEPVKREPLVSFSKSRFEEAGKQVQAKQNTVHHHMIPSVSEVPGKEAPKKTGNKMMDWIKKKSQGKEVKKEPQRTISSRINPPTIRLSTSKKTSKAKETPLTSIMQKPITTTSTAVKTTPTPPPQVTPPLKVPDNKQPVKQEIEIPEHNNFQRKRANSGNSTALKELVKREKKLSKVQMQIHQGAIDRSALTSQPPEAVMKEVARILRILGIETKREGEYVMRCHRRKAKSLLSIQEQEEDMGLEPIYGDASIDNGDEIRFIVEICRFKNLPGLYIVDVKRLKGNPWAYRFLYHKLIDFLDFDKNGYIQSDLTF